MRLSRTLWVRIMLAPRCIANISHARELGSRFFGFGDPRKPPRKDLRETDTVTGPDYDRSSNWFFRHASKSPFFTKTSSKQIKRDLLVLGGLKNLGSMPVTVSVSRKSFLGGFLGSPNPKNRLPSSLACEMFAIQRGASIIRTHNVRESRIVADMACR